MQSPAVKQLSVCATETLPFNPDFWNAPGRVRANNCYAYATNQATGDFPQPGYQSGMHVLSPSCDNDTAGAVADGIHHDNDYFDESKAPRLWVALVANTAIDYHWYRLHSEGFWVHKPGQNPATNVR